MLICSNVLPKNFKTADNQILTIKLCLHIADSETNNWSLYLIFVHAVVFDISTQKEYRPLSGQK